jgi:primary-amine oxidase
VSVTHLIRGALLLGVAACAPGAEPHATDPLTAAEITAISDTLRARGLLGDGVVVTSLTLQEPPKPAPDPATTTVRHAAVQLFNRQDGSLLDLTLALPAVSVVIEKRRDGVVPPPSRADYQAAARLVGQDSTWLAGLARRGLAPSEVTMSMMGPGVLGAAWEQPGHRYVRVLTRLRAESGMDQAPVEGLVAVVDLTDEAVATVIDAEPVPPPLDRRAVPIYPEQEDLPKPLRIVQRGRNYEVSGTTVTWAGWSFRFAMDPREGLVLHDVAFGPQGAPPRRILTRASLAEMLVPYGDPSAAWTFRSVFDAGEFGMGQTAVSLVPGEDLPENADRFDATLAGEDGTPRVLTGVIGLYERDGGLRWRHRDRASRSRELVIRSAVNVGNYDYGFSWVFSQDGVIAMEIDLTGRLMVKGIAALDHRFGTQVAPQLSGIVHQHFFNFRLDFDVDGPRNRVQEMEAYALPRDSTNPDGTAFAMRMRVLERESEAARDLAPDRSRMWIIENPNSRDSLGQVPGYALMPGPLPALLTSPDAILRQRGAFAAHALWVTAHKDEERYAAGEFPGQDPGGAGLPAFIADDEPTDNTDLVVWYTTGVSHMPKPEEWPMMPVSRIRFELRPRHFLTITPDAGTTP